MRYALTVRDAGVPCRCSGVCVRLHGAASHGFGLARLPVKTMPISVMANYDGVLGAAVCASMAWLRTDPASYLFRVARLLVKIVRISVMANDDGILGVVSLSKASALQLSSRCSGRSRANLRSWSPGSDDDGVFVVAIVITSP